MSISINGVGRVTSATSDTRTTDSNVPAVDPGVSDIATPQIDGVTNQPLPPRFPWLSRLALQLEAASRQRSAFQPAPVLGDNLDKTA